VASSKHRNQWTTKDWDSIEFNELSWRKKRERLFRVANYACPICGFNKRRHDGRHVLEIDHIDGDHSNNTEENLRVLCPNCHALTPNFRNWGRTNKKTSNRLRRENKGFDEVRKRRIVEENAYVEMFKLTVLSAHESGEINFARFGWVQQLSEKLGDRCPQAVSRRVQRLLPQFYVEHCFIRGKKRLRRENKDFSK